MRNWIFLSIIVVSGFLQATVLEYFKIFNVKPDLLLICVVLASLIFKWRFALAFSIFAGIFKDAFGTISFGVNTLMFSLWCFIIIKLAKDISIDNNFMRLTLLFIISISHHAILGLITIYSGNFIPLGIFLRIVLVESFYTVFVLLLVFKLIRPIYYLPQY